MLSTPTFKKTSTVLLLTLFLSVSLSIASAEKGRKGPPKEAIAACADQTEAGAACSFETPEGDTVEGVCIKPSRNTESLSCKPSDDSRRKKHQ